MNKAALWFDRPYVDAHPCFREMVLSFLEKGWEVDLYMMPSAQHPAPVFPSGSPLRVFFIPHDGRGLIKFAGFFLNNGPYRLVVATPQWALYWSARIGRLTRTPVVCLSDEVYPSDPSGWSKARRPMSASMMRKWKTRERWAHQRCVMTVALGQQRYELAKRENELPDGHPYAIVPNAPAGAARRLENSYYRDTLGIARDSVVLLHSGGMSWVLLRPLVAQSASWPERFTVVLQGRLSTPFEEAAHNARVKINSEILPAERMREVTSSADIGLALYDRLDPDEARNGATAGKIGLYLSCGLPVICCNLPSLQWVEKERCGVWLSDVSGIPAAAEKIMRDLREYSLNAVRVFDRDYEYQKHFDAFYERLVPLLSKEAGRGILARAAGFIPHLAWKACEEPFVRQFPRHLEAELKDCDTVLDVGCGECSPLSKVRPRPSYSVGVDVYGPAVESSRRRGIHDDYRTIDLSTLGHEFGPKSFDAVLCLDTLEHLTRQDASELLRVMERIARRRVIVFTPNGFFHQPPTEDNPHQRHLSGWTVGDFRALGFKKILGIHGWKPLSKKYPGAFSRPHLFWRGLSSWSQPLVLCRPERAFQILCVKDV